MQPQTIFFVGAPEDCEPYVGYAKACANVVDANKAALGLATQINEFDLPQSSGFVRVESMNHITRVVVNATGVRPEGQEQAPPVFEPELEKQYLMWMPEGFFITPRVHGNPLGFGLPNTTISLPDGSGGSVTVQGPGTPGGPLKDVILNRYANNLYPDALIGKLQSFPIAYNDLWNAPYLYNEEGDILGKNKVHPGTYDAEGLFQNQPYFDNRTLMNTDVKSGQGGWYCHRPYVIPFIGNEDVGSGYRSTVMKTIFDLTNSHRGGNLPVYGPLRGYYNQVSELTISEMVTTGTLSHGYTKYRLGARTFDQRLRTCGGAFPMEAGENLAARSQVQWEGEKLEDFRIRLGEGFMQWWVASPEHYANITRDWVDLDYPDGSICTLELAVGQGTVHRIPAASYLLDPEPYPNPAGAYFATQTFVKRYDFVAHAPQMSRWQGNLGTVCWVGLPNPVAVYRQLGNREYSKVSTGGPREGFVGLNHVFIQGRSFDVYRDNFNFTTGESRIICGAGMFSKKHVLSDQEKELRDQLVMRGATAAQLQKFDDSFPDEQYLSVGVLVMVASRMVAPKLEILIMPVGEPNFLDYWLKPGESAQHDPLRPGDDIPSNRYTQPPTVACSVTLSVDACEHMRLEFSPDGLHAVIRIAEIVYHANRYFVFDTVEAAWSDRSVATSDIGAGTDLVFYEFTINQESLTATVSEVHRSHVDVSASGVLAPDGAALTYTQSVDTTYVVWANYTAANVLQYTTDTVNANLTKGVGGVEFSEKSTLRFPNGAELVHRAATWDFSPGPYVAPNGFNMQFDYLDPINPERRIYSKTSVRQLNIGEGRQSWMPIRNTLFDETEFVDCKVVFSGDPPVGTLLTGPLFTNEVFVGDTKYIEQPYAMTAGGGITDLAGISDLRLFSSIRGTATIVGQPYATGGLFYEIASLHGCLLDKRTIDSRVYLAEDGSAEPSASKTYKANDVRTGTYAARLDGGNLELVNIPRCNRYRSKTQSIAPMVGNGRAIADWCLYDGQYIAAYSLYANNSQEELAQWAADSAKTYDDSLAKLRPASQPTTEKPFSRGTIWGEVAFGLPRSDAGATPGLYPHVVVSSLDLEAITGIGNLDGNIFPFGVI